MSALVNPFTYVLLLLYVPLLVGVAKVTSVLRMRARPRVRGVVVDDYDQHIGDDVTSGVTRELVEFTTHDGRRVVAEPVNHLISPRSRVGREVSVFYDPADPRRVYAPVTPLSHAGVIYVVVGMPLAVLATLGLASLLS